MTGLGLLRGEEIAVGRGSPRSQQPRNDLSVKYTCILLSRVVSLSLSLNFPFFSREQMAEISEDGKSVKMNNGSWHPLIGFGTYKVIYQG